MIGDELKKILKSIDVSLQIIAKNSEILVKDLKAKEVPVFTGVEIKEENGKTEKIVLGRNLL